MKTKIESLALELEGECYTDLMMRTLYSTDASAYSEMPVAVVLPRSVNDLNKLITFATSENTSLIPRTAGTSLAGQVVGNGIVVDVSKYFNNILELNTEETWVRVQPGVVRDELNLYLKPFGLFFGPETSTANRAMIGGMVGNNSCGSNSIVYKSTREHTLELKVLLSDGSDAEFKALSFDEFIEKCSGVNLESSLYRSVRSQLGNYENQVEIRKEFPKNTIERRNTGYAIDLLLDSSPFTAGAEDFNFCKLLAGSEGTLAFITEIKLKLMPLPSSSVGLLCVHFNSIDEALNANLIALKYKPVASELIDHYILECTKENIEQKQNRFFIEGDPAALLVIEYVREEMAEVFKIAKLVEGEMRNAGLGYHFPLLFGNDVKKIWTLRKAGLGLLSNLPGDEKAVPVIEDTAVDIHDLPAYIQEFNLILKKHSLHSIHYAHAGSGELHLRPILNLKTAEGKRLFRIIAEEIASLVKKYNGSLSGEHGDGRLRGEFIEYMVGKNNYRLLKEIKKSWDPGNIFNPGKIIETPPMDTMLRYNAGQIAPDFKTVFRFQGQNILQHAEQCNGSGDCRKSHLIGGTMCPSFMATHNEKDTTRARANILRSFLTNSQKLNRFDHPEIKEVMDLCLSCKGCKSECPSNVDMAKLKAEFLQHYQDVNGIPLRSWLVANFTTFSKIGALMPWLNNYLLAGSGISRILKSAIGFSTKRSMPLLHYTTLRTWMYKHSYKGNSGLINSKIVYLFCDEFTNYHDTEIGIKAVLLLERLGYEVRIPKHVESGRASISKGLLRKAKRIAHENVKLLSAKISRETPMIGIEPSAILTFRDEYLDLVDEGQLAEATQLASNTYLIEEFLATEIQNNNICAEQFSNQKKQIKFHAHCQQKAWNADKSSEIIMSFPKNYEVELIPSGCCGMAGSFGYEKEHYDLSMKIGSLVLFPNINIQTDEVIIAANGTSCRHQIKDGTGRKALHPVEVLYGALL